MMKKKWSLTGLVLALWLLQGCAGPDKVAQIDEVVTAAYENNFFIGSVLVAEHGKVIYSKGFGDANHEWEIPNAPDTKHRIASMNKQFTSMLVLQLVEEGRMSLEATVRDYLPEYPAEPGGALTIHQLLSHTSGMPHYAGLPGLFPNRSRHTYTPKEYMRLFWELDLLFEPGSQYSYSSFGYFLLGVILEEVTGETYANLLRDKILEPVGMDDSGMEDHLTIEGKKATGHNPTLSGFRKAAYRDMSTAFSTGAMFSTVEDFYLWDRALYSDDLLSPELKELMFTPNINGYGYGWRIGSYTLENSSDSVTIVQHGGSTNGFNSTVVRIIEDEHLIVLLANSNPASRGFWREIRNILYDQPYDLSRKPISRRLWNVINASGLEAALAEYRNLKTSAAEEYNFSERQLNTLGYTLMGEDEIAAAIAIFRLNVEAYPGSANVYDSLGEAYMNAGDNAQAITNYERSLALEPDNRNAAEMIAQLQGEQ